MKEITDLASEIVSEISCGYYESDKVRLAFAWLKDLEKEIRRDQVDKCAEAIRNIERYSVDRLACEKAILSTIKQ